MKSKLIKGGDYEDERGLLQFFNTFDMSPIKRIYFTTHFNTNVIRAWQGHKIESRWFCCVKGSFKVKLIGIDNWENPSENLEVLSYTLTTKTPEIVFIPNGYVNGFQALEDYSKLMIMSNYALNEIENDQVRFNSNKWNVWSTI